MGSDKTQNSEITYKRSGGYFGQSFEVIIRADHSVKFVGVGNVRLLGVRETRISEAEYLKLQRTFEELQFDMMESKYGIQLLEPAPRILISREIRSRKKVVDAQGYPVGWPKKLFRLMWDIEDAVGLSDLACPFPMIALGHPERDACIERRAHEMKAMERASQ